MAGVVPMTIFGDISYSNRVLSAFDNIDVRDRWPEPMLAEISYRPK